jgi:dCMP deaminase
MNCSRRGDRQTLARKSKDVYFAEIADLVSSRSTCLRNQVGAVIVKESQILSTGYNGAPKGLAHCEEVGCIREKLKVKPGERHELCRGLHAEQNAVIQAETPACIARLDPVAYAPRCSSMQALLR